MGKSQLSKCFQKCRAGLFFLKSMAIYFHTYRLMTLLISKSKGASTMAFQNAG